MSVTINTFPPLHTFTYSRSGFLAFIVVLHMGFFWVLTHGLSIEGPAPEKRTVVLDLPTPTVRARTEPPHPTKPIIERTYVPPTDVPRLAVDDQAGLQLVTNELPPRVEPAPGGATAPEPLVIEPSIGRAGLSEPLYPSQAIRMGHAGTVVLSVEVLANGRVGEVRLVQSSGFPLLDESAMREARRWRLVPGTRDGVPTTMWKDIPIKFQLRNPG